MDFRSSNFTRRLLGNAPRATTSPSRSPYLGCRASPCALIRTRSPGPISSSGIPSPSDPDLICPIPIVTMRQVWCRTERRGSQLAGTDINYTVSFCYTTPMHDCYTVCARHQWNGRGQSGPMAADPVALGTPASPLRPPGTEWCDLTGEAALQRPALVLQDRRQQSRSDVHGSVDHHAAGGVAKAGPSSQRWRSVRSERATARIEHRQHGEKGAVVADDHGLFEQRSGDGDPAILDARPLAAQPAIGHFGDWRRIPLTGATSIRPRRSRPVAGRLVFQASGRVRLNASQAA